MTKEQQENLYKEYHDKVFSYIRARVERQEDAEDLCADVFVKVFRTAADYDPSRSAPGTWIYAITRNTVIDHYRRMRPVDELPEELSEEDSLPEDGVLQTEMLQALAAAMERLPEDLTDIIVLCYYDRLPLTQVAERMGISYGAVKLRHQKALATLRAALA